MPFIPAPDTAKVILNWASNQNNFAMNIIWVKDELGSPTAARLTALNGIIAAWAASDWDSVSASAWELDRVVSQDWTTENSFVEQDLVSVVGSLAVHALPSSCTLAMSLRTGLAGRSFRGRLYHVGLTEDQAVGDFVDSTAAANIVAAYEALRADLTTADFTWSVASFYTNGSPRASAFVTPINGIIVTNLALDTMRSRHPND